MKRQTKTIYMLFFTVFLLLFSNAQQVNASVISYVAHGDACRFPAAHPSDYEQVYFLGSPSMMEMTGSHQYDNSNITVRNGTYSVYAPYDGYEIYIQMNHFYWMDSNVAVTAPGFSYNVTAWGTGNGGLFTDPSRGCGDPLTGISKYKVTLSAGTTTFTARTKNYSLFYIYAPASPPNKPVVTSYTDFQKITDTTPTLTWNYSHPTGKVQQQYRVARSLNGAPWIYDEVATTGTSHTFPALADGTWDFAVEVFDGVKWSGWTYRSQIVIDNTGPSVHLNQTMDNVLYNSPTEKRGTNEFLAYGDIAPTIDTYGLIPYIISFDIKADVAGPVEVYQQNGSDAKYHFSQNVNVTTSYTRKQVTVTPTLQNASLAQSMLAFYGTYGTGRIINVKNVQIQKISDYWTNQPISITASASDVSGVQTINMANQSSMLGRNFALNSDFANVATENPGWDVTLNGNLAPSTGWTSGHNGGVQEPTKGYHAHLDTSLGYTAMMYPNKNAQYGYRNRWLGIMQSFDNGSVFENQLSVGTKVTFSFDLFSDKIGGTIFGGLYRKNKTTGIYEFTKYGITQATRSYMWERKSFTVLVDSNWDFNAPVSAYLYGSNEDKEATKWIKNIKIEIGDKPTPYTKALEDIALTTNPKTYQVTQNGTYTFNAIDTLGNMGSSSIAVSNYDNTEPVLNVDVNTTDFTKENVTITASASDSQSGVSAVKLHKTSFDTNLVGMDDFESWYATSFVKSGNKIQFKNEDSTHAGIKIPYVFLEEGKDYVLSFDMTKLSGQIPYIGGHGYIDETTIEVLMDGVPLSQPEQWNAGLPYPNDNAKHHVTVKFRVASVNEWDKNFYIQPNRANYGTHRYDVLFENIQLEEGTVESSYTQSTKDFFSKTSPDTLLAKRNGTYEFRAIDYAGNETTKSITLTNVDKTPPNLQLRVDKTEITKENVTITAFASDGQSGVASVRLHKTSFDKNLIGMDDLFPWNTDLVKNGNKIQFNNEKADPFGSGIRIDDALFEENTQYVLSFDMTKLSGDMPFIGGHSHAAPTGQEVYVDGIKVDASFSWDGGLPYPNDLAKHHIAIKFTYNGLAILDKNIYIQPNRFNYGTYRYEALVEHIQLEKGTMETFYSQSTKDTFTKTNPGTLSAERNGTYAFVATDQAGNETIESITIANIDKSKPVIVFTPEKNEGGYADVDVQMDIQDRGVAGYKQYRYVWSTDETYPISGWSEWKTTVNPTITQTKTGTWYLHIEAEDNVGNIAYAMSGIYEKLLVSGGPSVNIHVYPMPTGVWVNQLMDVYIMESGDAEMLSKATKQYEITSSSLYPTNFNKAIPFDKKVQLNLIGENFIHVQYTLDDGTKITSTSGPYLIDTSAVGDFEMKLTNASGNEVTDWSNEDLRLVISDPISSSISGTLKQYRVEGLHTDWQPYQEGTTIHLEGETRIYGRIVNATGRMSEQKLVVANVDKTKPKLTSLKLTKSSDGYYEVTVKTEDALSGVKQVVLNDGSVLTPKNNGFHLSRLPIKPTHLTVQDQAGNRLSPVLFATEPVITFDAPYSQEQAVYRNDVFANLSNANGYTIGNRTYECSAEPCQVMLSYNTSLSAIHTEGVKETKHVLKIENIDKKEYQLVLNGKRNAINPLQLDFKWNLTLPSATLRCVEGGNTVMYSVSGNAYPLNGKNYTYSCTVTGDYKGQTLASETITIYPHGSLPIETSGSVPAKQVQAHIYIEETRIGKSYLINGKEHNYKYEDLPIPQNDVTNN